jgi:hypothetical protein
MKLRFLLIISILVFLSACQYDPFADDLATEQPKIKDVIGTYVFEKQTLTNSLTNRQTDNSKITFQLDGTFKAINIPNFTGQSDFHYVGIASANGKWHIATNGGVANGIGGTDPIWGMDLDSLPGNLQHIEFLGKKPPYKLIVTYGDPDEGAVMIFRKL